MTTTLKQGTNGPILELDPQLLSEAGIDLTSPLDIHIESGRIEVVKRDEPDPPDFDRPAKFREAMDKVNQRYGNMLKRLAE